MEPVCPGLNLSSGHHCPDGPISKGGPWNGSIPQHGSEGVDRPKDLLQTNQYVDIFLPLLEPKLEFVEDGGIGWMHGINLLEGQFVVAHRARARELFYRSLLDIHAAERGEEDELNRKAAAKEAQVQRPDGRQRRYTFRETT